MSAVVRELLDRALRRKARGSPWDSEELIREELFSAERLEQHAESLVPSRAARPSAARRVRMPRTHFGSENRFSPARSR